MLYHGDGSMNALIEQCKAFVACAK